MSTELTTITPMELIAAQLERGTSVDQLTKLFDLQERWEKQEAAKKFAASITKFQQLCPPVEKTKEVRNKSGATMYHFADYADLLKVIQPYLTECEIVPTFDFQKKDDQHVAICRIRVGTHVEETSVPTSIPDILNTNEAQRLGGMTQYGKRYSLVAALNIRVIGEDTDAVDNDDPLNDGEVKILRDMIDEIVMIGGKGFAIPKFASVFREGAARLEDIPRAEFASAVSELTRWRHAKEAETKKGGK